MLLRHKPEKARLTLDKEGFCEISELLKNTDFTLEELERIVAEDEKQRYSLKYWEMAHCGSELEVVREPTHIRANQGHSTSNVRLTFRKVVPPPVLYHGANKDVLEVIRKKGLLPMNRHHVHLSNTIDVAEAVGGRRKNGYVILEINTVDALKNGIEFFISENGVYLAASVPPQYLKVLNDE